MGVASAKTDEQVEEERLECPHGAQIYIDAFYHLDSDRPAGFEALMPIPSNAILIYCNEMEISGSQKYLVLDIVRRMDNEFLRIKNKRKK